MILYTALYLLPVVLLLASSAPDLQLSPPAWLGPRRAGRALPVLARLSLAGLGITWFIATYLAPVGYLYPAAAGLLYIWFARTQGPYL